MSIIRTALVIGGDGFLGTRIVAELQRHQVTTTTLSPRTSNDVHGGAHIGGAHIVADITDRDAMRRHVQGFDVVIHAAGNTRTPTTDTREHHLLVNYTGTTNVVDACVQNSIPRLIFISSSDVYGVSREHLTEDVTPHPTNAYAESKLLAEAYCREHASHSLVITVVRPSYLYGHGMYAERIIARLFTDARANPRHETTLRPVGGNDFLYVVDAARAIVHLALRTHEPVFDVYNVSSGRFTPAHELFAAVQAIAGLTYAKEPTGAQDTQQASAPSADRFSLSITKLHNTGFTLAYTLVQGLTEMYHADTHTTV